MFATVLGDSPSQWLQNFQDQEAAAGRLLTLQDVFDEFMRTYHGGVSEKLAEQQLNSLVYGKGECRDLVGLDSAFDRLALELYPGSETSKAAVSLLARIYSEAIRRGDEELWEKAMDAQPSTLEEWKVAVQNAYVIIETKKAHHLRARQEGPYYILLEALSDVPLQLFFFLSEQQQCSPGEEGGSGEASGQERHTEGGRRRGSAEGGGEQHFPSFSPFDA